MNTNMNLVNGLQPNRPNAALDFNEMNKWQIEQTIKKDFNTAGFNTPNPQGGFL